MLEFQATCPACGAPLTVSGQLKSVECPYCGAKFAMDAESGAQPQFKAQTEEVPGAIEILSPDVGQGEQAPAMEILEPVETPEQAGPVPILQSVLGGRLWLVIAIFFSLIMCSGCLCFWLTARVLNLSIFGQ